MRERSYAGKLRWGGGGIHKRPARWGSSFCGKRHYLARALRFAVLCHRRRQFSVGCSASDSKEYQFIPSHTHSNFLEDDNECRQWGVPVPMTANLRPRDFYLHRKNHMKHWSPLIGPRAAGYKWLVGFIAVFQAPAIVVCFLTAFFGIRHRIHGLTDFAVVIGIAEVLSLVVMQRLDRRAQSCAFRPQKATEEG
jgi:hypothetical protein